MLQPSLSSSFYYMTAVCLAYCVRTSTYRITGQGRRGRPVLIWYPISKIFGHRFSNFDFRPAFSLYCWSFASWYSQKIFCTTMQDELRQVFFLSNQNVATPPPPPCISLHCLYQNCTCSPTSFSSSDNDAGDDQMLPSDLLSIFHFPKEKFNTFGWNQIPSSVGRDRLQRFLKHYRWWPRLQITTLAVIAALCKFAMLTSLTKRQ